MKARGFTLIELLVVLALMAVLGLISVAPIKAEARRQKESTLRANLQQIREALDGYRRLAEEGRVQVPPGGSGYPPNLDVLTKGIRDASNPKAPVVYLLRRLPRDPFFPDAGVPAAKTWGLRSYESPPDEPREGKDVFDVYSLSKERGLNGLPYRQW